MELHNSCLQEAYSTCTICHRFSANNRDIFVSLSHIYFNGPLKIYIERRLCLGRRLTGQTDLRFCWCCTSLALAGRIIKGLTVSIWAAVQKKLPVSHSSAAADVFAPLSPCWCQWVQDLSFIWVTGLDFLEGDFQIQTHKSGTGGRCLQHGGRSWHDKAGQPAHWLC